MSAVFLVRHGEARDTGGDPGLSDRGRDQVAALANRLRGQQFSGLWHSPKRRAAETAALLHSAIPAVAPEPADALDDRTPVPSAAHRGEYTPRQLAWLADVPADERDVDGVQLDRSWDQLTTVAAEHTEGPLLAVTHAFVIAWFVRRVMDAPPSRWMGLNCAPASLTIVDLRPSGPVLRAFNDSGHTERN